jgi:hypothetical protein
LHADLCGNRGRVISGSLQGDFNFIHFAEAA